MKMCLCFPSQMVKRATAHHKMTAADREEIYRNKAMRAAGVEPMTGSGGDSAALEVASRRFGRTTTRRGRDSPLASAGAAALGTTAGTRPPATEAEEIGATLRSKMASVPPQVPHDILTEKEVIRVMAYTKENVPESPIEATRVRKVEILLYTTDSTMEIKEPKIDNSGLPQGLFLKRHKIVKRTNEDGTREYFDWRDMLVGCDLQLYGRTYRIYDADPYTRRWYALQGIEQDPAEEVPVDDYQHRLDVERATTLNPKTTRPGGHKKQRYAEKTYMEAKLGKFTRDPAHRGKWQAFHGQLLRFDAVWEDRRLHGDTMQYVLQYHLEDDTVDVAEVHPQNDGRDRTPWLVKRGPLPRNWQRSRQIPGMDADENTDAECIRPSDLRIGGTVNVYGRDLKLRACDRATRTWYREQGPFEQPAAHYKAEAPTKRVPLKIPPHTGFGDEQDSMQSVLSFKPQKPKKKYDKWADNTGVVFKFKGRFADSSREDSIRRFTISLYPEDDTLGIFEPVVRNSGMGGGKFLVRSRYRKEDSSFYEAADFTPGKVTTVMGRRFIIDDADVFTRRRCPHADVPVPEEGKVNMFPRPRGIGEVVSESAAGAAAGGAGAGAAAGSGSAAAAEPIHAADPYGEMPAEAARLAESGRRVRIDAGFGGLDESKTD